MVEGIQQQFRIMQKINKSAHYDIRIVIFNNEIYKNIIESKRKSFGSGITTLNQSILEKKMIKFEYLCECFWLVFNTLKMTCISMLFITYKKKNCDFLQVNRLYDRYFITANSCKMQRWRLTGTRKCMFEIQYFNAPA